MRRYSKYKDSGVQWIGEIPSHWLCSKLKYNLHLINNKVESGRDLQYLGMENIESNTAKYIPSEIKAEGQANFFESGDILFGKLRPYLAKVYKAVFSGCCSTEFLVYRTNQNADYFKYVLLAKPFIDIINASTYGAKMPRANSEFIGKQYLPVPSDAEQHAIVLYLDRKVSLIDEFVVKTERQIELLKEWKQAEIARAVTKGLDSSVKMKDSGISWIGEIPQNWKVEKAKHMFVRMQRPVRLEDEVITCFRDGEVTLRRNRRTEGFTESLKEIGYQGIRRGDLVIHQMDAFAGSIGVSNCDGKGTPVYICLQPIGPYENEYYANLLRWMANSGYIKSLYRGIRERSSDFRFETFANCYLPVPPIEEQLEIIGYIERITTKADKMIVELTYEVEHLKEYRQRLISDVVTGKINVQPV